MASAIHHGPPGSFKSFTLVQRFVIDALKEGRVVITNIRGLTSIDRIQDQFPETKFPDSAELYFINADVAEGRQLMARWFHWVPFGALVVIDEGQRVYPKRRDFRPEHLDVPMIPPGFPVQDLAIQIDDEYTGKTYTVHRPTNIADAFDLQRHFQWDIYISTPHIDKILDPIREVCQAAYRHKSLSNLIPFFFKNTWYEFKHDPDNSGKASIHISGKPRKYKADERIFNCYQSTATGEHTESKADQSVLGDPKVKFLALVVVLAFGTVFYILSTRFDNKALDSSASPVAVRDSQKIINDDFNDSKNHRPSPANGSALYVSNQQNHGVFDSLGFRLLQIAMQCLDDTDNDQLSFIADTQDGLKTVTFSELFSLGVRASIHGLCKISLIAPDGAMLKLGCSHALINLCSAAVDAPNLIIRRDCLKYGEPKKPLSIPQNALVATASTLIAH